MLQFALKGNDVECTCCNKTYTFCLPELKKEPMQNVLIVAH
jgi:hypothetical protein